MAARSASTLGFGQVALEIDMLARMPRVDVVNGEAAGGMCAMKVWRH